MSVGELWPGSQASVEARVAVRRERGGLAERDPDADHVLTAVGRCRDERVVADPADAQVPRGVRHALEVGHAHHSSARHDVVLLGADPLGHVRAHAVGAHDEPGPDRAVAGLDAGDAITVVDQPRDLRPGPDLGAGCLGGLHEHFVEGHPPDTQWGQVVGSRAAVDADVVVDEGELLDLDRADVEQGVAQPEPFEEGRSVRLDDVGRERVAREPRLVDHADVHTGLRQHRREWRAGAPGSDDDDVVLVHGCLRDVRMPHIVSRSVRRRRTRRTSSRSPATARWCRSGSGSRAVDRRPRPARPPR